MVGFTIGSRGKVPGKTCEKRRRNNNNNNNNVHAKYYSPAECVAVVKVIQRQSHFHVIHSKGTINSLGYRSTNCCDSDRYLYDMTVSSDS
jgi:hypothetical protein